MFSKGTQKLGQNKEEGGSGLRCDSHPFVSFIKFLKKPFELYIPCTVYKLQKQAFFFLRNLRLSCLYNTSVTKP